MGDAPDPDVVDAAGAAAVEVRGNRVSVTCADSRAKARVVADLVDRGHDVVDVGSESASLEELFAVYTGRATERNGHRPGEQPDEIEEVAR
jgi:ABC-2 type transport system ATP-binding protein